MSKQWCLEFHCKDCELGNLRVEKIITNVYDHEEVKALVSWLAVHNAQGGTYHSIWRMTHTALFDQMILDGWTLNSKNNEHGDEWLEKGVIRINIDHLEVRKSPP